MTNDTPKDVEVPSAESGYTLEDRDGNGIPDHVTINIRWFALKVWAIILFIISSACALVAGL